MSDINLDFTVNNNSINFTVEPNDITITPTDVQLTVSTNSIPFARGANTQVQYNNQGVLDGSSTFTFDNTSNTVTIAGNALMGAGNLFARSSGAISLSADDLAANSFQMLNNGNVNLGDVGNLTITGGTNGYVLQTDGAGNLDWTAMTGGGGNGTPGGSNTQIQYNDAGAFGGNAGFTFNEITGAVNIPGNISATSITGFLATPSQTAITAVGSLTSLSVVGTATIGNITTTGNLNIGNLTANNANINNLQLNANKVVLGQGAGSNTGISGQGVTIGYFAGYTNQGDDAIAIGDAAGQTNQGNSSIAIGAGAGFIGQGNNSIILNASATQVNNTAANTFTVKPVRNANTANALFYNATTGEISYDLAVGANFAAYAGVVTTNAQPNITSVGTLTNLSVTGNITSSSIFVGSGSGLTQLTGANVTGTVANATYSTSTGNIPIVVNPVSGIYPILMASSNSNIATTTFFNYNHVTGVLSTGPIAGYFEPGSGNQVNITGLGTLTSLSVSGNATVGNLSTAGNITGGNILSAGLINGNSNITIAANSNVTISANGNANIFTVYKGAGGAQGVSVYGNLTSAGANITSLGVGTLTAIGNITVGSGNFYIGNGSQLTGVTVAVANTAGTVTTNAQPNITSVGTLTGLNVVGSDVGIGQIGTVGNLTVYDGRILSTFNGYYQAGVYGSWYSNTGNLTTPNASITSTLTTPSLLASNINFSGTLSSNNAPAIAVNTTIQRKLPIVLNGTTYYIALTLTV
jgi:hypothetical protein